MSLDSIHDTSYAKGLLGEQIISTLLTRKGLTVTNSPVSDLKINHTLDVEVKTATPSKANTYKFCLKKDDKYGHTDYTRSDYVLLQIISKSGIIYHYLIPSNVLEVKYITISNPLKGKYAQYLTSVNEIVGTLRNSIGVLDEIPF